MIKRFKSSPEAFDTLPIKERVRLVVENARNDHKLLTDDEHRQLISFNSAAELDKYNGLIKWYSIGTDFFRDYLNGYHHSLQNCTLALCVYYRMIVSSFLQGQIAIALRNSMPEKYDENNDQHYRHNMALRAAQILVSVNRTYNTNDKTITLELKPELDEIIKIAATKIYKIIEDVLVTVNAMKQIEDDTGVPIFSELDESITRDIISEIKSARKNHNDIFYRLLAHDPDSLALGYKKTIPKLNEYIIKWPKHIDHKVNDFLGVVNRGLDQIHKDLRNA